MVKATEEIEFLDFIVVVEVIGTMHPYTPSRDLVPLDCFRWVPLEDYDLTDSAWLEVEYILVKEIYCGFCEAKHKPHESVTRLTEGDVAFWVGKDGWEAIKNRIAHNAVQDPMAYLYIPPRARTM